MNVATFLESAAREHPGRVAVMQGEKTATYAELNCNANRLANGLVSSGVRIGDRVALTCPSCIEFVIAYYAILKVGAAAVTLNILLKRDEIAQQLEDSSAKFLLSFEGGAAFPMGQEARAAFEATPSCERFWAIPATSNGLTLLAGSRSWNELMDGQPDVFDSVDLPPEAACSMAFTSGTTGRAKCVEHSHAVEGFVPYAVQMEYGASSGDIFLATIPLFTLWRISALHLPFWLGAVVILVPRFVPEEIWDIIARKKVSLLIGSGAVFRALSDAMDRVQADFDAIARHWRLCVVGGYRVPSALHQFFRDRFGLDIVSMYGSTELHGVSMTRDTSEGTDDCVGRPLKGVQVRIVDQHLNDVDGGEVGEILVRTPALMKRYYGNPDWTRDAVSNGWFRMGDLGRRDADGTLYLAGRIKDMINRKGLKVFPAQVENALLAHPAVALAAVIGVPDERAGEEVKAYVQLKPGAQCTAEDLIAWARQKIAAHAYPRQVEFVERLPVGSTGKVLKHLLSHPPEIRT